MWTARAKEEEVASNSRTSRGSRRDRHTRRTHPQLLSANMSASSTTTPIAVKQEVQVKSEVKSEPPSTSVITLRSSFAPYSVPAGAGFKHVHVARFTGVHGKEREQATTLPAPVRMQRAPPEPEPVAKELHGRRARAKYQAYEVSKDSALAEHPDEPSQRRHRRLLLDAGGGRSKRAFDGTVEAGVTSSYVLFVPRGPGEFGVVPVTDWYSFKKRASLNPGQGEISIEDIEKHIAQQRRTERLLRPKSALTGGADDDDDEHEARGYAIEQTNESMDPAAYESARAQRGAVDYGTAGEMASAALENDADFDVARSDDDGVAPTQATAADEQQARADLAHLRVIESTAADSEQLNETGKKLNKLLKRHEGDSESSGSSSESDDDEEDDDDDDDDGNDDDDDDDDPDADTDDKLSGKKRKALPGDDGKTTANGESLGLANAKRVRLSGVPVQPPSALSATEMRRVVRESGALMLGELVAKFRALLHDNEQNKAQFKQLLQRLAREKKLIFETDAEGTSFIRSA